MSALERHSRVLERLPAEARGGSSAEGDASSPSSSSGVAEKADRALACRGCGSSISRPELAFGVDGGEPVRVFPNPYGQMRKILTVRDAWGIVGVGEPTMEFTWFDGFAWTAVMCASCHAHLGWRFDASGPRSRFFGLLIEALIER
ncbi:MAG: hypothetical protein HYV07_21315 [Deltaproteobacteria bacterium]|nr:hypothetical protein [Deltaproteobacteria bacterium]